MLTIPNLLTLLRLLLVPCFLAASLRGMYTAAFALFVGAAVTDIFDGWIARRFNMRSKLGAILDPAADKTMMVCGFLFYTLHAAVPHRIPAWLTFVVFIRDFMIAIFAYLLYTRVQIKRFPPTWAGKASTLLQAFTLAATIAMNSFLPGLTAIATWTYRASMLLTLYSGWGYMRRAKRILLETPTASA